MTTELEEGVEQKIGAVAGRELSRLRHKVIPVVMQSQLSREGKYSRLVEIADKVGELIAPGTPCRRGCSACCHIAVAIADTEARRIAAATGVELVPQRGAGMQMTLMDRLRDNVKRFSRVPCTFLGDAGECTIYEHRPIACRTHHTVAPDATCCDTFIGVQDVPALDVSEITFATGLLCLDEAFADIRDYFPCGLGPVDGGLLTDPRPRCARSRRPLCARTVQTVRMDTYGPRAAQQARRARPAMARGGSMGKRKSVARSPAPQPAQRKLVIVVRRRPRPPSVRRVRVIKGR